ncbi:hypothetical protein GOV03_01285 [Candidatus Woesearchaeota archaeon]|nr:hypothetical protein [Candidatus Woesearchaeota archaeon]
MANKHGQIGISLNGNYDFILEQIKKVKPELYNNSEVVKEALRKYWESLNVDNFLIPHKVAKLIKEKKIAVKINDKTGRIKIEYNTDLSEEIQQAIPYAVDRIMEVGFKEMQKRKLNKSVLK